MSFSFVKHKYILKSGAEIENTFKESSEYITLKKISDSCRFKNNNKDYFDSKKFESKKELTEIKLSLNSILEEMKESYLSELDEKIELQQTDKKIDFLIRRYYYSVDVAINILSKLGNYGYQLIVIELIVESYKKLKQHLEEHYSDFTEFKTQIKKENKSNNFNNENPHDFNAFKWATIFYFVNLEHCKRETKFNKSRLEDFIKENKVTNSYANLRKNYYKVINRLFETSDYPIEILEDIEPYLRENYRETLSNYKRDLNYLREQNTDY